MLFGIVESSINTIIIATPFIPVHAALSTSFYFKFFGQSPRAAAAQPLPTGSYFAPGRGSPLFGCSLALGCLCCCCGRGPSGVAPGALACRVVSLPSSGKCWVLGAGLRRAVGLFMAQGSSLFKHKLVAVSTSRLVQLRKKTGHTVSRLRQTPPNSKPPSSQIAWRK